jgi:hypothetical protein
MGFAVPGVLQNYSVSRTPCPNRVDMIARSLPVAEGGNVPVFVCRNRVVLNQA